MLDRTKAAGAGPLDEMVFAADLSGNEGLDPNYLSRIRIHVLIAQHQGLIQQMQFADAKAAALMTVTGLLAVQGPLSDLGSGAGLATGISQSLSGGFMAALHPMISLAAAFFGVASLAMCLWAIVPRYPRIGIRRMMGVVDRFSWPSLATPDYDAASYAAYMRTSEASQLVASLARSNSACANILFKKFHALRYAFILGLGQFVMVFALIASG
ncbi:MAG: Pycsar system effector family protein [Pseudomonadota bacterium]